MGQFAEMWEALPRDRQLAAICDAAGARWLAKGKSSVFLGCHSCA
jgi:hypothetical protein